MCFFCLFPSSSEHEVSEQLLCSCSHWGSPLGLAALVIPSSQPLFQLSHKNNSILYKPSLDPEDALYSSFFPLSQASGKRTLYDYFQFFTNYTLASPSIAPLNVLPRDLQQPPCCLIYWVTFQSLFYLTTLHIYIDDHFFLQETLGSIGFHDSSPNRTYQSV